MKTLSKLGCFSLLTILIAAPALCDQKIKTKSNIKNDRTEQPSSAANCSQNSGVAAEGCTGKDCTATSKAPESAAQTSTNPCAETKATDKTSQ